MVYIRCKICICDDVLCVCCIVKRLDFLWLVRYWWASEDIFLECMCFCTSLWLDLTNVFGLLVDHRAWATGLWCIWFCAVFLTVPHVVPAVLTSPSVVHFQVFFGRLTLLFPCGFQSSALPMTFLAGFLRVRVRPVCFHFLLAISCCNGILFGSCPTVKYRNITVQ